MFLQPIMTNPFVKQYTDKKLKQGGKWLKGGLDGMLGVETKPSIKNLTPSNVRYNVQSMPGLTQQRFAQRSQRPILGPPVPPGLLPPSPPTGPPRITITRPPAQQETHSAGPDPLAEIARLFRMGDTLTTDQSRQAEEYVDRMIQAATQPLLGQQRRVDEGMRGDIFNSNRVHGAYTRDMGTARAQTRNAYGNLLNTIAAADKNAQGAAGATKKYLADVYSDNYQGSGANAEAALSGFTTASSAGNAGEAVRGVESQDAQNTFLSNAALVGSSQNAEYIRGSRNRAAQERAAIMDKMREIQMQRANLLEDRKTTVQTNNSQKAGGLLELEKFRWQMQNDAANLAAKGEAKGIDPMEAARQGQAYMVEHNKLLGEAFDPDLDDKARRQATRRAFKYAQDVGLIDKDMTEAEYMALYVEVA